MSVGEEMRTATIIIPDGYESAESFAADCGVELIRPDWRLAPVEPNDKMLNAAQSRLCEMESIAYFNDHHQAEMYKAMIEAATGEQYAGDEVRAVADLRAALSELKEALQGIADAEFYDPDHHASFADCLQEHARTSLARKG